VSKLESFKNVDAELPESYQAWELFGAGLENMGQDGVPTVKQLRPPRPNEVVLRSDALGLCLSDIKIIKQGSKHPRLRGRDLSVDPTVLGHECSATVVAVGENYADDFNVGERYIVQADIYYKGEGFAFGYLIPGGLGQYCYVDQRVIEGDEGCYLLPVKEETGYSKAALAEPWACVEMSYNMTDRFEPGQGRVMVVTDDDLPDTYEGSVHLPSNLEGLANATYETIIVFHPKPAVVETLGNRLKRDGVMILLGEPALDGVVSLDVGAIHYEGHRFFGGGDDHDEIEKANSRNDLLPCGSALFVGAGGPMGQMHVQRAIEIENGPKNVVVTDLDRNRMDHIQRRFGHLAQAKGIELFTYTPGEFDSSEDFNRAISGHAANGFNDICILAPVASLVSTFVPFAADSALVNIFAGLPVGTRADIALADLCRGVKIFGSSGSRISDLRKVLKMVEAGELDPNLSIAAIGGMEAARDGLEAVMDAKFPGKTVIYPHISGLPLMTLDEFAEKMPELQDKLGPDNAWTTAVEKALLESLL
jgi:threonine dehydrogenase-like Zn-dependent dehydrogenase